MTPVSADRRSHVRSERSSDWRTWCCLALVVAAVAAEPAAAQLARLASVAQYAYGFRAQLPSDTTYSRRHGLRLEVDSRWPNNYGYRPIRVRVVAEKPATVDERITLRLHVGAWDWRSGSIAVEQGFDLPLGASSAETVISCPQFQAGQRYWWEVRVDGVLARDLSVAESAAWQLTAVGSVNATNTALKFLMVGTRFESQRLIGLGSDVFEALALTAAELPSRWIDYSAIDVVALSPNDLQTLASARPEALDALRRWNRAGGQLWINPVGNRWEQLDEVERLLQLPPPATTRAGQADLDAAIAARGWKPIEFGTGLGVRRRVSFIHAPTGRNRVEYDPNLIAELKVDPEYIVVDEVEAPPLPAASDRQHADGRRSPTNSAKWYVQRPAGLGYVRAYRRQWDPVGFGISWRMLFGATPNDVASMPTPLAAAIETTRTWDSRHGMTPDSANADFANWLVPGVGLAPVTEFRVLITVFVLLIGPLNYWLLKRTNRLHLMLLTVPAVAITLTSGLFAYAFLSDGLSTTARVRSFTALDQNTGEAACWARLSYYSSLAPQRGLKLPADVTLYPILPGWNMSGNELSFGTTREMLWTNDEQWLTGGWLRSRVPTQFLSIRARQSPHRLELAPAGEQMSATNRLGTRIEYVAVADERGRVFTGEALTDRSTARLSTSTHEQALSRLRQLLADNEPEAPPELAEERVGFSRQQRRQRRRGFRVPFGTDFGVERLRDNLQSQALVALATGADEPVLELPPRTYVAVTATGPEVELGIVGAEEEASFHVVVGNW